MGQCCRSLGKKNIVIREQISERILFEQKKKKKKKPERVRDVI
jgi:hypothetical protein